MENWLKDEDLAEAMSMAVFAETFAKSVKSAVKARLEENPECVPGYKLKGGGNVTSYDAKKVANIIIDSNVIGWDQLLEVMKFSMTPFITIWASHTGMSKAEAKKDLQQRFKDIARTKPKAPSIIKAHAPKK
jgi:hypothetical protein